MRHTVKLTMVAVAMAALAVSCGPKSVQNATKAGIRPHIWPDYVGVTIPVNIAPMDFCMLDENVELIDVVVKGRSGKEMHVQGKETAIFPMKAWKKLLHENVSDSLMFSVSAYKEGKWKSYEPFGMYVSPDEVDYGLNYRLIAPGYQTYSNMGIYERDLSTFKERALITNEEFNGCVNCHSYNRGNPDDFSLHIRGGHGATVIRKDGHMDAYNTKADSTLGFCVYPYWHPSGKYIAYSTNSTMQTFHVNRSKLIEVFDKASDLQIYDVENNQLITAPQVKRADSWETYPVFSAAGDTLFFCAAEPVEVPLQIRDVHYNLYKVAFDPATGTIGKDVELVLDAASQGKSICFPAPSYDGKYIMYTLSDYGNFSIWHPEADLWLLDLETRETRPVNGANSHFSESYHQWSSTSRWFVVASRRVDGAFTRPYICHMDEQGHEGKAFLVPQKEPRKYYRAQMRSYNRPDFVTGPVNYETHKIDDLINSPERTQFGFRWSD